MLAPVKTRKMLASDTPMTAEKAQKAIRAPAVVIFSMRKLKKNTNASGAKIATHFSGVLKIAAASAGVLPMKAATRPVMTRPIPMLRKTPSM